MAARDWDQVMYKRYNQFSDWLDVVQGTRCDIPEHHLSEIKMSIDGVIDARSVRDALKKLRLRKYSDQVPWILNRLRDAAPAAGLTPDIEDQVKRMFCELHEPFQRLFPDNSFLSHAYVLAKLLEILDQPKAAGNYCCRSRQKLLVMDSMWMELCKTLGWTFYESCPP